MTPLSLRQTLDSLLDRPLARRYLRAPGYDPMPARFHYNAALRDLSIKDAEGAISHLIMALEMERDHAPSLHLAKTMLFGLSQKFHDEGGHFYKQKHPDLAAWGKQLDDKLAQKDQLLMKTLNQKRQRRVPAWWDNLFPRWRREHDAQTKRLTEERDRLKEQLRYAHKMSQLEEFSRVLGLVLEICLHPGRYAWVSGPSLGDQEDQLWYA